MRTAYWISALMGLAGLMVVLQAGCLSDYDDLYLPLTNPALADAGTGGGTSAGCNPTTSASPVADTCGVFVSSSMGSDASLTGSKKAPYQTLAKALGAANGKPVYACGETFTVTQTVTLAAKVDLYGALDCAKGWAYDATNKTQLQADTTMTPVPLTLASGASGSSVHDFAITAADATMAGGSSIAVLDDQANLTLENVDIDAGAGKDGTAGAAQSQVATPMSANGTNGADDPTCNMMSVILGGAGGTNTCNGTVTNGGNGGKGAPVSPGADGLSGQPMTPSNGGKGQTAASCTAGTQGIDGTTGTAGTGAQGIGDVSPTASTGYYQALMPMPAGSGALGQGGGGGGAAQACDVNDMFSGPSGGGGGAGGCGGAPGNPGTSGGSSIGILAFNASLTLTTVAITTQAGGVGGAGGAGQKGANGGGSGDRGGSGACPGGLGGQGGAGGPGGGGAGGHSVGIAVKTGTLPTLTTTTITPGGGGMGGAGGDTTAQTQGAAGLGCKTLDFTNPALVPPACVM
jgi:hypothetical protein